MSRLGRWRAGHRPPATPDAPRPRALWPPYWEALDGLHRRSVVAIVAAAVSGVLEVAALAMLLPLLETSVTAGPATSSSGRLTRWLEDAGFHGNHLLYAALAIFAVLGVLAALVSFFSRLLTERLRAQTEERLRGRMVRSLTKMSWPSYLQMRFGDITSAVMMEGGQSSIGVLAILRSTGAAIIAALFIVFAFVLNWQTTLFTLAFGMVLALLYRATGRRAAAHGRQLARRNSDIGNQVSDVVGNLKFFKSTGDVDRAEQGVLVAFREFALTDFWTTFYRGVNRLLFEAGGVLFVAGVLLISILLSGALTAEAVVFVALFYRLLPQLMIVQDNLIQARTQLPWYEEWRSRISLVEAHGQRPAEGAEPRFEHEVAFNAVSYRYPGRTNDVLDAVSWRMTKGECVAVVGESGSGKTTMLDILSGLLSPTGGDVEVDGRPLSGLDIQSWEERLGLVLQESPLFHATVAENIAWGADHVDRDWMAECARMAHAKAFVDDLPEGFDTVIGERGGRLSGGQRQRVALARALYRRPWLLLLDEATSALDGPSEAQVQAALGELKGTCTMVMVAHRLSSVRIADRIIVMASGSIVEEGTWDELMARHGLFADLATRQGLAEGARGA